MVHLGCTTFPSPVNPPAEGCRYPTLLRGEPPAPRAVASRGRVVPGGAGCEPRDRFLPPGEARQQGLPKPLGAGGRRGAGVPWLARGWAGLSRSHRLGLSKAVSPCCGAGQRPGAAGMARPPRSCPGARGPAPPRCSVPWSIISISLLAAAGSRQGCPTDASPTLPTTLGGVTASLQPGSWGESWRRAGERGAALPFPPRVSVLAEAEHYLPRPSEAAAHGCAPSAYL